MKLRSLAKKDIGWLKNTAKEECSVISTRIRLARNLKDYPFPNAASEEQLDRILKKVFKACDNITYLKNATKIKLDECSDVDRRLLLERKLISHEHAISSQYGGVIIDDSERISIMVNEEDHLRIQYIMGGLNLFDMWEVISKIDDEISDNMDYAYSDRYGFLTACPTNTGTGMRASCQMHLPGLGMTNKIRTTMENINKMGMVVRGIYGEGTKIMGNILQISNQVTLGISEQRVIDSLRRLVVQVSDGENKICKNLLQNNQGNLKDNIFRARGVLANAYKISFEEALNLISNVRMGVCLGILDIDINRINDIIIKMQPAHIQELENRKMDPSQRDVARAKLLKKVIKP
ncbi:MAG: protein arginine kinase [Elusimicrobiota bacterium]